MWAQFLSTILISDRIFGYQNPELVYENSNWCTKIQNLFIKKTNFVRKLNFDVLNWKISKQISVLVNKIYIWILVSKIWILVNQICVSDYQKWFHLCFCLPNFIWGTNIKFGKAEVRDLILVCVKSLWQRKKKV